MKTASWFTYDGPGRIAICRSMPRNVPAGYRIFRPLAPGPWFNSVSAEEYLRRYAAEVLAPLDPLRTWDTLHALAAPHEPVLMCWERPPFTATHWCHRRTCVATWFRRAGLTVDEIE